VVLGAEELKIVGNASSREMVGDFRKLEVWQKTQKLVSSVYKLTGTFPTVERYGLSSQMRRAAVSVSANLAEGCGRMGDIELRRFVRISLGSLSELECELLLASDLRFLESQTASGIVAEIHSIRGMLQKLHRALPAKPTRIVPRP
jgi:four helix bundle protein